MQHAKAYSAGAAIRELERQVAELQARNALLLARLHLAGIEIADAPPWLMQLTPAQRRIMYALHVASPFEVDRWDLLVAMGSEHDASLGSLQVQIGLIRDRLGRESVETIVGFGYRLGEPLRKPQPTGEAA
jgi:DNA-binding response OmpR family regulator